MAKYLGHDTPLGAFYNLGSWVQRRALGSSSLSILDLRTFYPQGFPVISTEDSDNEPQHKSSAETLQNTQLSTTLDTVTAARKPDPETHSLDDQTPNNQPTALPDSTESITAETTSFRTSLQRYFTPPNQVSTPPDLVHRSVSNQKSAIAKTATDSSVETAADCTLPDDNSSDIEEAQDFNNQPLQRSTIEQSPQQAFNSSQPSVAETVHSIQRLQTSSSTSQTAANVAQANVTQESEQKPSGLDNDQSTPNGQTNSETNIISTTSQQPPAGLTSTDINQSLQSLRAPVQRSVTEQDSPIAVSSGNQPDISLKSSASSSEPPAFETPASLQKKHLPTQRLQETPLESTAPYNQKSSATPGQRQILQRQPAPGSMLDQTQRSISQAADFDQHSPDNNHLAKEQHFNSNIYELHDSNHPGEIQRISAASDLAEQSVNQSAVEPGQVSSELTLTNPDRVQRQDNHTQVHNASSDSANTNKLSNSSSVPLQQSDYSPSDVPNVGLNDDIRSENAITPTTVQSGLAASVQPRSSEHRFNNPKETADRLEQHSTDGAQTLKSATDSNSLGDAKQDKELNDDLVVSNLTESVQRNPQPSSSVSNNSRLSGSPIQSLDSSQPTVSKDNPQLASASQVSPSSETADSIQRQPNLSSNAASSGSSTVDQTFSRSVAKASTSQPEPPISIQQSTPEVDEGSKLVEPINSQEQVDFGDAIAPKTASLNQSTLHNQVQRLSNPDNTNLGNENKSLVQNSSTKKNTDTTSAETARPLSQSTHHQASTDFINTEISSVQSTASSTEIQRLSNPDNPDLENDNELLVQNPSIEKNVNTSSAGTTPSLSPSDYQPSSSEFINTDISNVQSAEPVQLTVDSTLAPTIDVAEPNKIDPTQLANTSLAVENFETAREPQFDSGQAVQRAPDSTLSALSNPGQFEPTQPISDLEEKGSSTTARQTPVQSLSSKSSPNASSHKTLPTKPPNQSNQLENRAIGKESLAQRTPCSDTPSNEPLLAEVQSQPTQLKNETINQASVAQRASHFDDANAVSLPEKQSASAPQLNSRLTINSAADSTIAKRQSNSFSSSPAIQRLSDPSDRLSPQTAETAVQPSDNPAPEPLTVPSTPNLQKASSEPGGIGPSKYPKAANISSSTPTSEISSSSLDSIQSTASSSVQQAPDSSVTDKSGVSTQNPLQRQTNPPSQSTDIPQSQIDSSTNVVSAQEVTIQSAAAQNNLARDISETAQPINLPDISQLQADASTVNILDATSPLNSLQRQSDTSEKSSQIDITQLPTSEAITQQTLDSSLNIQTLQEENSSTQKNQPEINQPEETFRSEMASQPTMGQDFSAPAIQKVADTSDIEIPSPSAEQQAIFESRSTLNRSTLTNETLTTQQSTEQSNTSLESRALAEAHPTQQHQPWSANSDANSAALSAGQRDIAESSQSDFIQENQPEITQPKQVLRSEMASQPTMGQDFSAPAIQKVADTSDIEIPSPSEEQQATLDSQPISTESISPNKKTPTAQQITEQSNRSLDSKTLAEAQSTSQSANSDANSVDLSAGQRDIAKSSQSGLIQPENSQPLDEQPPNQPELTNNQQIKELQPNPLALDNGQPRLENVEQIPDISRTTEPKHTSSSKQLESTNDNLSNSGVSDQPQLSSSIPSKLQRTVINNALNVPDNLNEEVSSPSDLKQPVAPKVQTTINQSSDNDSTQQRSANRTAHTTALSTELTTSSLNGSHQQSTVAPNVQRLISTQNEVSGTKSTAPQSSDINSQHLPLGNGLSDFGSEDNPQRSSDSELVKTDVSKKVLDELVTIPTPHETQSAEPKTQLFSSENEIIGSEKRIQRLLDIAAEDSASEQIGATDQASKGALVNSSNTFQQPHNSVSKESLKANLVVRTQEVPESKIQPSSNVSLNDNNHSLEQPPLTKHQLPYTEPPSLPATGLPQYTAKTNDSLIQQTTEPSADSNETQSLPDTLPTASTSLEALSHVDAASSSIQRSSTKIRLENRQQFTDADKSSKNEPASLNNRLQRQSNVVLSHDSDSPVLRKALGVSRRRLPKVLKPLGVLKPLPSLQVDQPTIASQSVRWQRESQFSTPTKSTPAISRSQTPLTPVQRQNIPNQWSDIESADLTSPNQQPLSETTLKDKTTSDIDSSTNSSTQIQRQTSKSENDTSENDTNIQQQQTSDSIFHQSSARESDTNTQQQDTDHIPSEWSNLEDLVTHLQGSRAPDQVSAKSATANQSTSRHQSAGTQQSPKQPPQTIKVTKPATVTVQRQVTSSVSSTKPTIIQACKDDSADASVASSSNHDDQTDTNQNYSQYLELLVQEVYSLLRQRLSLEQERRGPKYPR